MENELKEIIFNQFDSYYKAIPKRGFTNTDWTGYPTLHKRCENLYWKRFYLPPQLLLSERLTQEDFNEIKELGHKCLCAMIRLRIGIDNGLFISNKQKFEALYYIDESKHHLISNLKSLGIIV